MKKEIAGIVNVVLVLLLTAGFAGCGSSSDDGKKIQGMEAPKAPGSPFSAEAQKEGQAGPPSGLSQAPAAAPMTPSTVVAQVNDARMTKSQLDAIEKEKIAELGGKIPPENMGKIRPELRRQIVDFFIVNALLTDEIKKKKIQVSDREIKEAMDTLKASLPSGVTLDEMLKRSKTSQKELRQQIVTSLSARKLVAMQPGSKGVPSEKDVADFYKKNEDKFKIPETVHARHILIATAKVDDAATKAKKKEKAEGIHKQLLAGGDFAAAAKANSDCPSKENGGDLGSFGRGQMVKPFEDAAFSQKKDEIGPVVETEFGYHIIQVLDHAQPRTQPLDRETKARISAFLAQKKERDAYSALINRLRATAKVYVAERLE